MLLSLAALAVLGLTTGFLVGQAGATADILAAVLPVVVGGGGAAAIGLTFSSPTSAQGRSPRIPAALRPVAAAGVIVFSIALLAGNYGGTTYRFWTLTVARDTAIQLHRQRQKDCMTDQYNINAVRKELGIPKLPSTAFCPATPPN